MNAFAITIAASALNRTDAPRWLKAMANTAAVTATIVDLVNLINDTKKKDAR